MGIADLLRAPAQLLPRRLVLTAHQPRVRQELADLLEARQIVYFVQKHQSENGSNAGDGTQPVIHLNIVYLGRACQVQLHFGNEFVELIDQVEIQGGAHVHRGMSEPLGDVQLRAVAGVAQLLAERRQVVLRIEDLQVCDQLGTLVHQVHPPAQQVTRLTHPLRIDVRQREVAALEQAGNLGGVESVVLRFAAVDQLHIQRVTEDEGNVVLRAAIRQPVPAEHAFRADDQIPTVRREGLEQCREVAGKVTVVDDRARTVQHTYVHGPGVQINARIK